MAEGLRLLGSCPRCHGDLVFADDAPVAVSEAPASPAGVAPHMVLGIPRPEGL